MNSRHLSKKVVVIAIGLSALLLSGLNASSQLRDNLNLPDHDSKFYHLGIALIYNNSHFQVSAHPQFLQSDSILSVNPLNTGGFGLAGMHTLKLSPHFEFRVVFPQLMFSYKNLDYSAKSPSGQITYLATKKIESILLGFPVQIKFLSDRIDNFRVYMLGGINYQYDLASNATARKAQDLVKLKKYDFSVEAGIGFQFFFPVFILSPELKISNGLINEHSRDPTLIYSSTIDKLRSRMIVFSLIFEG
ncbi:MAG: outer membrane beta-barrel protein [Bacteroidetes bacterium]|nr:outer membrane beta-barrel protein [Bacteroidota bacterium]